ncbi:DgyrCDS11780 [Dimorphilus gyrociliatus]|uniref:DgyrCDS11780 n=1 Tax=Dimorphilus gyrociliatus TaxID=2664684 RepID=A0A7I8W6B0_9ANNE|nr:DgyrCDS11780 [Dimorphilus gyrociliatus]
MDHPLPEIDPLEAAILSNNRRSSSSKDPSPALPRNCLNLQAKPVNETNRSLPSSPKEAKNFVLSDFARNAIDNGETSSEDEIQTVRSNERKCVRNSSLRSSPDHHNKEDIPIIFVESPSKRLFCNLCGNVFTEPVIVSCGHTFCKDCVETKSNENCPVDSTQLEVVAKNLTVAEQIGELLIRCRYGCLKDASNRWDIDNQGCLFTVRLIARKISMNTCEIVNMLNVLIRNMGGCKFCGTATELAAHMANCQFESVKDYLRVVDERINELQNQVSNRENEIEFLHSMLGKVCERMDTFENTLKTYVELSNEKSDEVVKAMKRQDQQLNNLDKDVYNVMEKLNQGLNATFDPLQVIKCKGTLVGHNGPVWCLYVHQELLFSGSSDKTIKVWDTSVINYKCISTLAGHEGIVLAVCVCSNKLYSGSQDYNIISWDLNNLELQQIIPAHDDAVCTLAAVDNRLFSGSLKEIREWDASTNQLRRVNKLTGLDHWVRALVANHSFLYAGSYDTIKVWNLSNMECVLSIYVPSGSIYSLAITDTYILCGTNEKDIHVWERKCGTFVQSLKGHTGTVNNLAVVHMSSGMKVISASYDQCLRVWSLDNLICTQTLARHQGSVACLAVSRGRVFSGAVDGQVKVWQ